VADSSVKLSAKFSKTVSDNLKNSYAQRISPGTILALSSFELALVMRKTDDGYRRTVRLTITGLHGRGLRPSKGPVNAEGLRNIEKLDFIRGFFNSRELKLHQSQSLANIPPEIATASFSSQPSAPPRVGERPIITNRVLKDSIASPDAPGANVERSGRAKDQVADVIAVQDVTPTGVVSRNMVREEGAWVRDFPQSVPYWGEVSDLVFD
jgi:hypothetical protein